MDVHDCEICPCSTPGSTHCPCLHKKAEKALLVHPDDVNLADVKALAAEHGVSAEGNRFVPRGHAFLVDEATVSYVPFPPASTGGEA